MKRKDILLIALVLAAALLLYGVSTLIGRGEVNEVVVSVDGREALRVPLAIDGVYSVPLPEGEENTVEVRSGAAFMHSANCRDQLCVNQGQTRSAGKQIVCLPHRVIVQLEKAQAQAPGEADDLDVVVR